LRLKLQSHSAFLYNEKEIYPFIQSTFVAFRAKLEKMVLHTVGAGKNTNNTERV